jgi:hypothetical protein
MDRHSETTTEVVIRGDLATEEAELQRALAALSSSRPERAPLLLRLGEIGCLRQSLSVAELHLGEALSIFQRLADQARAAVVHRELGKVLKRQGRFPEAHRHLVAALDLFAGSSRQPVRSEVSRGRSAAPERGPAADLPLVDSLLLSGLDSVRILKHYRGDEHPIYFAQLLVVPTGHLSGKTYAERVGAVETLPIPGDAGRSSCLFGDVMDNLGAFVETSPFLIREWRERYGLSDTDVIVYVPVLLRTSETFDRGERPDLGGPVLRDIHRIDPGELDAVSVISLPWAGAADVAALLARHWGLRTDLVTRAARRVVHGVKVAPGDLLRTPPGINDSEHFMELIILSSSFLEPRDSRLFQRRHGAGSLPTPWVNALDHPEAAIAALEGKVAKDRVHLDRGGSTAVRAPIILITMSDERLEWAAYRSCGWQGPGSPAPEGVSKAFEDMRAQQRDLVRSAGQIRDRKVIFLQLPDPHAGRYKDARGEFVLTDPIDMDFDAFWSVAEMALDEISEYVLNGR